MAVSAFGRYTQSINGQIEEMSSNMSNLAVQIGTSFGGATLQTFQGFNSVLRDVNDNFSSYVPVLASVAAGFYGLEARPPGERPREFDVAFFARARDRDHCGVACMTADGLMILHCVQRSGVLLDSLAALRGCYGFRDVGWFRHRDTDAALRRLGWLYA